MSFRRLPYLLLAVALATGVWASSLAAQTVGTITGQVTDAETGANIAGAQLVIVGTNIGTITNQNGRYLIPGVPVGQRQIRVVIIGYEQQTRSVVVAPGSSSAVDFALATSAIELEGIVVSTVTGREQRSRELGTNVSTIDLRQLEPTQITSVYDVLSGRSEGVILQDVNGTTGTAQRIRIRGANSLSLSNEPLIYVDGVQFNNASSFGDLGVGGQDPSRLTDLNPNDIENIEIVKGPAAAALYGTAAANGVLLITTKRGRAGAPEWNFYAEGGAIDDITDYPANYMAYEVIGNASAPFYNPTTGNFNSTDYRYCPNRSAAAGSCTQDGVATFNTLMDPRTRAYDTGNRQRYGASVRGGSDRVTYYLSGEMQKETGVVDFNTMDKYTVRANLNAQIREDLDVDVSTGFTHSKTGFNSNDNSIFSALIGGLLGEAYYIPESAKPTSGRGANPGVHRSNYGFGYNMWDKSQYVVWDNVDRLTLGANAQFRPLTWLSLNANGGLDLADTHTHDTVQRDLLPIAASWADGFRESQRANDYGYTFNTSAIGTFQPADEVITTFTVGGSYNRELLERTRCYGSSLTPGTASCGTTASLFEADEDFSEIITIGGYVSGEVGWRDRVFLAAAIRGDDNSAFGTDFGFVTYPSASLSWVIGEEDWFPQWDFLSALRLRTAWGTSGLRPGFRDAVTLFSATTINRGGGDEVGVTVNSTGNEELKPEKSVEYELGFDVALFNNRVGIDFTYFNKKSRDALIERDLPPSYGVAESRFENLGEIKNAGTETAINVTAIDRSEFGLNLRATMTTLDNEVVALGEGIEPIVFNRGLQRHDEGYPAGGFWQQKVTWNDDGDGLLTNDEVELSEEAEYIGPALPTFQTSLSADIRVFDWLSASTLFEYRGGNYQGNDSESFRCGYSSLRRCRAVGDPTASLFEQARYIADRYLGSAYGYVEKADFWKWREVSVTLRAPRSWTESARALDGLSLTFAGRNLATWTDYSGLDPETVEGGGSVNFSQSEFNTQPPVRYLMVRLNYTLR